MQRFKRHDTAHHPLFRVRLWAAALTLAIASIAPIVIASLAVAPLNASAQVINFRHYTSGDGLPQSQVLSMDQDARGYLWFGTYGGLTRFNGRDFRTYTKSDGLVSNSVFDVAQDDNGRLLAATSRGLCILEAEHFQCFRQSDGLIDDNASSVAPDHDGGAWVGTGAGLSHLSKGKIHNYTTAQGLPADRVNKVAVDAKHRVWVATEKGLARLEGDRFVLQSRETLGDTAIQFITAAKRGLLVGVGNRLYMLAGDKGDDIEPIAAGAIPDSTIFVDGAVADDGTIWAATRNGALRIHGDRVDRIDEANGLLSNLLNRVMIDREGDVWFGTEGGASKHVPGPFRTYTEREGVPSPLVRALQMDGKGRLWMGTRHGVAVRDGERFIPIPLLKVPDNRIYSLARDPDDGMLIGTRRGLLWYSNGRIRQYHEKTDNLPGEVILSLLPDGKGGVWIGTDRGLARWERGVVTRMDRHPREKLNTISLALDHLGRLWMGHSAGGVTIVDGDSVRTITAAQGGSDQTIWAMSEDAQGRMWIGTNGDGALRVDGDQIRRFTTRDGLASDFIWQTLNDSHGDTWLYGNLGLDRFSGTTLSHYGLGSGLIQLEGAANASYEDSDHNLWFGTGGGVVRFTPGRDVVPATAPPVYVEDLAHDGTLIPLPRAGAEARLSRGRVQIHFASPSFRNESAIRFRYRLLGEGDDWSAPTSERSITYAGLSPGSYLFQVVATNGGVQSAAPATIAFTIVPAFWQTWWCQLLAVGLLIAVVVTVPVLRARALEKERRRLEALVAQHTRELADKNARLEQSNRDLEHFAYVASHDLQEPLRKIQAFSDRVVKAYAPSLDDQGRDYLGRMSGAAARMQRLIDDLLSLSRVTTKANRMESVSLSEVASDVLTDLELRLHSTRGRVEIGALPEVTGDPVQLRQIFLNLIGNALKFHRPGEAPVVRVSAAQTNGHTLEIRFDDNGIGFETKDAERVFLPFQRLHGRAEFEGTGIGLTICQKIAERHGGTIRAESIPGKGSRFIVALPIHGPVGERHAA